MKNKVTVLGFIAMLSGCAGMGISPVPIDLSLEVGALGGLIKVKPHIVIGDGKVGPTSVDVESAKPETIEIPLEPEDEGA